MIQRASAVARARLRRFRRPAVGAAVATPRVALDRPWKEPPVVENPGEVVASALAASGGEQVRFDVELFETLNQEYASRPVVPRPQGHDTRSRAERARTRLARVDKRIGLAGQRVLEFGCGAGYEVWFLAHEMEADAYGIDVVERRAWSSLQGPRVTFRMADITAANPFAPNFFDRIISFSVFEHVAHPFKALTELHRILKPGGCAWISANLHRSAIASHRYADIFFPWPHLLFSDNVIREWDRTRGGSGAGASWVNTLTWSQYERHFERIGFEVEWLTFSERAIDEDFYARFEDVLGRYPRFDLEKDFFNVVLRKRVEPA